MPYRSVQHCPLWLARVDRYASILRDFRWYRRRVGGTWVRLWAHLVMGGGFEWWHSETLDAHVSTHCLVMKREIYTTQTP